jgi:tRNA uridine 5-carbamoylmethylation protein Kti12
MRFYLKNSPKSEYIEAENSEKAIKSIKKIYGVTNDEARNMIDEVDLELDQEIRNRQRIKKETIHNRRQEREFSRLN